LDEVIGIGFPPCQTRIQPFATDPASEFYVRPEFAKSFMASLEPALAEILEGVVKNVFRCSPVLIRNIPGEPQSYLLVSSEQLFR